MLAMFRMFGGVSCIGLAACAATGPGGGAPPRAPELANTSWVGVVEGGADARQLPRLSFSTTPAERGAGGRVQGFTGCNMLSGAYKVEGGVVKLGPMITTKRFCVGPEMEYERRLLAAMGEDSRVTREGDRLVIASGKARFEFTPAKPD